MSDYLSINGKKYELGEDNWLSVRDYVAKYDISTYAIVNNWVTRGVIPKGDYIRVACLNNILLIRDKPYSPRQYNPRPEVTPNQVKQIWEWYNSGERVTFIAKHFNLDAQIIYRIIKKLNDARN